MYDAMMSDRPYRRAVSSQVALAELKRQTLTQFDPAVVDAFFKVVNTTSNYTHHEQAVAVDS